MVTMSQFIHVLCPHPQHQLGPDGDVRLSRGGNNLLKMVADVVHMESLHVSEDVKIDDTLLKDYIREIVQEELRTGVK